MSSTPEVTEWDGYQRAEEGVLDVVIVGAGLAGLAAALAMHQADRKLKIKVFEHRPQPQHHYGAGLRLEPNGLKAAQAISHRLLRRIRRQAVDAKSMVMYDTDDTAVCRIDCSGTAQKKHYGHPTYVIGWSEMERLVLNMLPHGMVHFGVDFLGYQDEDRNVSVYLRGWSGGDKVKCRVLVGADGPRSAVRRQCLNDGEPTFDNCVLWSGRLPEGVVGLLPTSQHAWWVGGGQVFMCHPLADGDICWEAACNIAELAKAGVEFNAHTGQLVPLQGWRNHTPAPGDIYPAGAAEREMGPTPAHGHLREQMREQSTAPTGKKEGYPVVGERGGVDAFGAKRDQGFPTPERERMGGMGAKREQGYGYLETERQGSGVGDKRGGEHLGGIKTEQGATLGGGEEKPSGAQGGPQPAAKGPAVEGQTPTGMKPLQLLLHLFRAFPKPVQEIISGTYPDSIVQSPVYIRSVHAMPPTMGRGRVVLIGEAAAPLRPTGQAENVALEDAAELGRAVVLYGLGNEALREFERVRRPRWRRVMQITLAQGLGSGHTPVGLRGGHLDYTSDLYKRAFPPLGPTPWWKPLTNHALTTTLSILSVLSLAQLANAYRAGGWHGVRDTATHPVRATADGYRRVMNGMKKRAAKSAGNAVVGVVEVVQEPVVERVESVVQNRLQRLLGMF